MKIDMLLSKSLQYRSEKKQRSNFMERKKNSRNAKQVIYANNILERYRVRVVDIKFAYENSELIALLRKRGKAHKDDNQKLVKKIDK